MRQIVLTAIEQLDVNEAARIEGCNTVPMYWRIHEARKRLKGFLERVLFAVSNKPIDPLGDLLRRWAHAIPNGMVAVDLEFQIYQTVAMLTGKERS